MKRTVAVVLVLLTGFAAGCGSARSGEGAAAIKGPASPSSASPIARVSLQTACEVLFPGAEGQDPLLQSSVTLVNEDDPSPAMVDLAVSDLETLRRLAPQTPSEISGQLDTYINEMEPYLDDLQETGEGTIDDTTTLKAAGIEITNRCLDVL